MNDGCRACGKTIDVIHVDYYTMTGRKKYPSLSSKNYDQRYGFTVHEACLTPAQKKRFEDAQPKGTPTSEG